MSGSTPSAASPVAPGSLSQLPLALLRAAIGWHFFYEGFSKLIDPGWTAAGYLQSSTGLLSGFFHSLAADPAILKATDLANVWGLMAIGVCLLLGLFTRLAALSGIALLGLYYLCHPPLFAEVPQAVAEGSYLLVNKNLVELLALAVVAFLPASRFGLDGLIFGRWGRAPADPLAEPSRDVLVDARFGPISRRQWLTGLAGVPIVGGLALAILKRHGWKSIEEMQLASRQVDGKSGATLKFEFVGLDKLQGQVPRGKIRELEVSRVILGGNLMGGWAHARDLIYVSKLVKAYHHEKKIYETLAMAEQCGVNTLLTNPLLCEVINRYWQYGGGKIQFISDCGGSDVLEMTRQSIDAGACACYIQGGVADRLVEEGQFDLIAQMLELVRASNLPAGIGGHKLATIQACVDRGFEPDFWMKTLHHTKYWSAQMEQQNDNIWCEEPDETIAYMKELQQPWIAFKVLAAGAIHPKVGFKYAFQHGADFICVGMYDFQLVENINLACDVLNGGLPRQREWYA